MEKLQELLKWLGEADDDQIDSLYEVVINKKLAFIEDVVGKDTYRDYIFEEYEIKCDSCGCDITSPILCEYCIKDD